VAINSGNDKLEAGTEKPGMAKGLTDTLDAVFGALADPTRRAMLEQLSHGPCSIGSLSGPFDMSAPAISKHLRVLERSGLITRSKAGRITYCRLTEKPFADARQWLHRHETFWEQQFDALDVFLKEGQWPPTPPRAGISPSGSRAVSRRRASASSTRGRRRTR
jgi:DNA-binding transcriptional ArsR family regulator